MHALVDKMSKQVVEDYIQQGYLIHPDAIEQASKIPAQIIKKQDTILMKEDFLDIDFRILKNIKSKDNIETNTFMKYYMSKYEKIKNTYPKSIIDIVVSISNIHKHEKCNVLAFIKNIGNDILIEDFTGSIKLTGDVQDFKIDDVAVFEIDVVNSKILQIIYPDIPIRDVKKSKGILCFLNKFDNEFLNKLGNNFDYILIGCDIDMKIKSLLETKWKDKIVIVVPVNYQSLPLNMKDVVPLSNPSALSINGINLLISSLFDISMLKKRHLENTDFIADQDYFCIEEVPDIVFDLNGFGNMNHKSVTVVSENSVIDLSTRDFL